MTTLAELVAATPAATRGVPTGFVYGTGEWRHVTEIADPAAGSSVAWHELPSARFAGYEYTRGSDGYQGRYRASVVTLDLWTDSDEFAPWNPDTSPLFGVHVKLGTGLLIRSGFIRVVGGVVDAWNPRFTNKVEFWGDASYSKGKARQHRIIGRDTLTSMVGRPLPATFEENWSDRMFHWLTDSGWPYGSAIYGAQFEADTTTPILVLPDRPAASSAINELAAICDPVGLVYYTNRLGQLVVRPIVYDTFHADAFAAGATGDQWPTDVAPVGFSWAACAGDDGSGNASYAVDHSPASPFGLDDTEAAVINHVVITAPTGTFDDDDPVSIQRYDPHDFQASWMAENDTVAAALLAFRANATVEARPLDTTIDLPGFHPGPARADYLDYVTIDHRNSDDGLGAFANGYLRSYREQITPRGCDTLWQLTLTLDVYNVISDAGLLPVEDLALVDVTDTTAEFSWTNPDQTITPTHTQVRLLNPASLWLTTDYPITGLTWAGLAPSTSYEFQVRLIRIDDGLITHYSPTRSLAFTTDEAVTAHVDPGDGTADVDFPDPGACVIGWELQWSTNGSTWTTIDSGTTTAPAHDLHYDTSGLNPAYWYRFAWRNICAGVPGAWHYDNVFPTACMAVSRLGVAPYSDSHLIAYWPQICPDHIAEAKTGEHVTNGPALHAAGFDPAGVPTLVSGTHEGVVIYDAVTAPLAGSHDATIACRAFFTAQPVAEQMLFEYGNLRIGVVAHSTGFRVRGHVTKAGGTVVSLDGTTDFLMSTIYDFALTHDVGVDNLRLYVNAVEQISALGVVGARANTNRFATSLPASSWITDCAVWDRVLANTELPGYVAPPAPTVTINKGASQADPAGASPIIFDVVFSEAVTGFATGDVTLSASTTPGTLVGTVTGSGTTYTVTVTGMTGNGNVTASIAAAVCTSVATAASNAASTSTDNTVAYAVGDPNGILGAKLLTWWDFTDLATLTLSGSNITLVNDKCPNDAPAGVSNFQLAGSSGVSPPASVAAVINGLHVARFDGATTALHQHGSSGCFMVNNGTIEIWAVAKSNESGAGGIISEGNSGNAAQIYRLVDNEPTDVYTFNFSNPSNVDRINISQARSTGAFDLVICTDKGASVGTALEVVNVGRTTGGAYTRDSLFWDRLAVGCYDRSTHDGWFDGDIAEILVLSSAASSGERSALAAYFNAKYAKSWSPL